MKPGTFIRELIDSGCYLKRHGNKHDIYANPANGKQTPIPRHSEIKDTLYLSENNWVYERSVTGFESSRQGCESWRMKVPLPTVAQKARNNHKKYNIKFAYIKNCKFTL